MTKRRFALKSGSSFDAGSEVLLSAAFGRNQNFAFKIVSNSPRIELD